MTEELRMQILERNKKERNSYLAMVRWCCDSMIMNNSLERNLAEKEFYFDPWCGDLYDEEEDSYAEIYQQYIIDEDGARRLAEYTNEIVMYCEELDIYLLCVTHW